MRFSSQREIIREIVESTNAHPTADWIYTKAKKRLPNLSLGTVYRNLKQLDEEGTIKAITDGKCFPLRLEYGVSRSYEM
jgi:Fur family ferric uptake transcriptional regulator/Fur family peroxide stress response transcriptional regulator